MRRFRVLVQPPAQADIEESYGWLREQDEERADEWLEGLERSIRSLERLPARCPIAPESRFVGREIRQLLHGKGRSLYRVYFMIDGNQVRVLHVRHRARRPLRRGDLS